MDTEFKIIASIDYNLRTKTEEERNKLIEDFRSLYKKYQIPFLKLIRVFFPSKNGGDSFFFYYNHCTTIKQLEDVIFKKLQIQNGVSLNRDNYQLMRLDSAAPVLK